MIQRGCKIGIQGCASTIEILLIESLSQTLRVRPFLVFLEDFPEGGSLCDCVSCQSLDLITNTKKSQSVIEHATIFHRAQLTTLPLLPAWRTFAYVGVAGDLDLQW